MKVPYLGLFNLKGTTDECLENLRETAALGPPRIVDAPRRGGDMVRWGVMLAGYTDVDG